MTATQAATKDQAQQMAESASQNPSQVPTKFKDATGKVNVEALAKAYRELERKQSGGSASDEAQAEQDAAATSTNADPLEALEQTATTQVTQQNAVSTFDEALSQPVVETPTANAVDWNKVTAELQSTGKLSDVTTAALKKQGIPDALIQSAIGGFKAQQKEQFNKAAQSVGGVDKLNAVLAWVNKTFAADKKQQILSALRSPAGEQVLLGLNAQYAAASGGNEGQQIDTSAGIGGLGGAPIVIKPYATDKEIAADMNNPKYQSDPEFQSLVAARMYVTKGGDPRRAATMLRK